jgi:hypothetical protein
VPDEEPSLARKVVSYGTLILLAALVGGGFGFGLYVRAVSSRRAVRGLSDEERAELQRDWSAFWTYVGAGASIGAALAAGGLVLDGSGRRRGALSTRA